MNSRNTTLGSEGYPDGTLPATPPPRGCAQLATSQETDDQRSIHLESGSDTNAVTSLVQPAPGWQRRLRSQPGSILSVHLLDSCWSERITITIRHQPHPPHPPQPPCSGWIAPDSMLISDPTHLDRTWQATSAAPVGHDQTEEANPNSYSDSPMRCLISRSGCRGQVRDLYRI